MKRPLLHEILEDVQLARAHQERAEQTQTESGFHPNTPPSNSQSEELMSPNRKQVVDPIEVIDLTEDPMTQGEARITLDARLNRPRHNHAHGNILQRRKA
ncbi:hypothetical protein OIU84_027562 [Salix udensis]|uniref:Uncharacterized protein n=1 Tax=Salix udensis TaxID=889485 RepID=A0AAD6KHT5_9ROSI|nr:hypothetical protein OIU84_027562 [Salix udensis]